MKQLYHHRSLHLLTACLLAALLAACGGGGSGDPVVTVSPQTTSLNLHGTAAAGLAIAGATVNAKCRNGTGTGKTGSDGTFDITMTAGSSLPCVLEVSNTIDSKTLHAISVNGGVINLTSLTEMLSTRLMRASMKTVFANPDFDAIAKAVTADNIKTAQADISKALSGMLDTSPLGDFYSTPLKAATVSNPTSGDAQDRLLDSIRASLYGSMYDTMLSMLAKTKTSADILVFGQPGCLYYGDSGLPQPCAGPGIWTTSPYIVAAPAAVMLPPNAKYGFTANINYPPNVDYFRQPVRWSVQEADAGSISINGEYTAPAKPGIYHVIAQREDYPALTSGSLVVIDAQKLDFVPTLGVENNTVRVMPGESVGLKVQTSYSPTALTIRQPVSWSVVESDGGSITQQGNYTAPARIGTYHVRVQRDDFPSLFTVLNILVNYPPD
ncbi:hypothetical protein [Undibacterium sp. TS12]|uniref:hypothetical protein n=1 Tax=Undibacterium sp. TS12 TaxID=2908202 RepID=UPI001F4D1DB0|nr:hypothetical protein [Undibacterium sp. TS12]MCH8622739.1 hypothetical protein [Undibacterium sp. TS12]